MHIKQITLSNFRSFRQQPEIHPFSSGTNTIVGRNGSGKSNLFDAVQFVLLAPKFWSLRSEDRQALLHEGPGSAAVNAFVEIIFDNSDNRFSLENSDEVVLRRTIGHKKDEFFLQRKRATKNEVMSLLEGAGFSKSNPYFIVQQGKVNALCLMSDLERLNLLKEVAGTTVYDEKKAESLLKMEENSTNMKKIDETLVYMEEKLDELRGEKEELTQFHKLDRDKRAVAYTLYDKELRRDRDKLDEIEHTRADEAEERAALYEEARETSNSIQNVETKLKSKTRELRRNMVVVSAFEQDYTAAMTHKTSLELQFKELEENVRQGEATLAANKLEIERLDVDIQAAQKELNEGILPIYNDTKAVLTRMTTERDDTQKKIEGLYAKQGRGRLFQTKEERDASIQSQVDELNQAIREKRSFLSDRQDSLANQRRSVTELENVLKGKSADVKKKSETMNNLVQSITDKQRQRNDLAEQRKSQWRELDVLTERVSEARENARRAFSTMRKIMPRATAMGLNALDQIVQQEGIIVGEQYFGPLMQNFELVDPKFQTAVEVAAQNALFHVIVDTDSTAAKLMNRLEHEKLGRVTFLPLNQLRAENVTYPESSDVTSLLQRCIRYDGRLKKAMQHVFAKKLLARSVDIASTWSTQCDMDAITLDGDLCSRKGALTGGFVDLSKSRLRAHYDLNTAEATLSSLEKEEREKKEKNNAIDQEITNLISEIQRLEAKKAGLDQQITRIEDDIVSHTNRLESSKKQIDKLEAEVIPNIETEMNGLLSEITILHEEIGTELSGTLSEDDKILLHKLKTVLTELEKDIETQSQSLEDVSVKRQRLQSLLNDNLLKRKRELEEEGSEKSSRRIAKNSDGDESASGVAQTHRKENLDQLRRQLDESIQTVEELSLKLQESKQIDQGIRAELIAAKDELENLKSKDLDLKKTLEDAHKREQKLMNKRSLCISQRELHMRMIQELGSLPPPAELAKYASSSIASLNKELEKIKEKLKKYSYVNKKAYDQFVNFSEQRESLLKRKEEVDQGAEKVKELVENLDRQKDEAINRTFRGVSAHFKDVFKELVPDGAGELIMKTSLDEEEDSGDEDGSKTGNAKNINSPSINRYTGIGIKVRFSSVGENYLMSQLSGGQKTLVALALIFAIQRCDPAPFYLFDELDQALDSTYRAAVASLIQRQANNDGNPTQFICSTFRPELVAVANRCYGISHQNKVSSVHQMSKKDALNFIANLMNEDEAVGEVTSLATSKLSLSRSSKKRKAIVDDPSEEYSGEEGVQSDDEITSPIAS